MNDQLDHAGGARQAAARMSGGALNKGLFSCETIFCELRLATARLERQLSYLFATGSSESCLRDALAYQLHTKYRNVAREYRITSEKQRGIADIAVLGNYGNRPKVIIELKQLYLKELSKQHDSHRYVGNIVSDITRWSQHAEVFGVVFVRRIRSGAILPCANPHAHVYLSDDGPNEATGVERMHRVVTGLSCATDFYPTTWEEALIHPQVPSAFGVELYGWVIRRA